MTRQRIFLAMLTVGVILSLASTLQADTKVVISHSNRDVGLGLGVRIGAPIVAPGRCLPPARRHVIVTSPRWHRFVRIGPPVVVHPPVVQVVPPPVVRQVVIEPAPVVLETTITVWITNSNGSRSSVQLTREGPWYVGPRGEYYSAMPTNEQLRVVYGF